MGIAVTFYSNFNKRGNSTKQPTGGTTLTCELRDGGSSVLNPNLEVRGVYAFAYNYMYIESFKRYYYIDTFRWNAEEGFWLISGVSDPLASFRDQILNTTAHVVRSASAYDDTIADGLCVPIGKTEKRVNPMVGANALIPNLRESFYNSTVIVNIAGTGLVMMSGTEYDELMMNLFAQHDPATTEYWTQDVTRRLLNPSSYIINAMAIPIDYSYCAGVVGGGKPSDLMIGWFKVTGVTVQWVSGAAFTETTTVSIPLHPQAQSETHFVNYAPYVDYKLYLAGIGYVQLDSSKVNPMVDLTITSRIDVHTGGVTIRVMQGGTVVGYASGTIGYNLAVTSRQSPDMIGMMSNVLIGGAVGGVMGAVGGGLHAVNSLAGSGTVSVHGNTGGAAAWTGGGSRLIAEFKRVKYPDNATKGRPLYQSAKLSTLSGYTEVLNGSVNCGATLTEHELIRGALEGGFYIE